MTNAVVAQNTQQHTGAPAGGGGPVQAVKPWPFSVGALSKETRNDYDQTVTMSTGTVQFPNVKVEPDGWLRGLWFDVTGTCTGNTATVTFNGDAAAGTGAPFTGINSVLFRDSGTEQIFGKFNGYDWMTTNKFGGYQAQGDPRADQNYSTTTGSATNSGSFHYTLYLPLEISIADSLGSLENRSENSIYKVELVCEQSSVVYTQAPTNLPTVEVKVTQDSYFEPTALTSLGGRPTADAPPAPQTTQYWKQEDDASVPGAAHSSYITNGIGYGYRMVIFKMIRTSGTRANGETDWPDPLEIYLGSTRFRNLYKKTWQDKITRNYQWTTTTKDTALGPEAGVFVLDFIRDMALMPGNEARRRYLRTKPGQTFKLYGTYGNAGTLWMTENYVIPRNNDFASVVA